MADNISCPICQQWHPYSAVKAHQPMFGNWVAYCPVYSYKERDSEGWVDIRHVNLSDDEFWQQNRIDTAWECEARCIAAKGYTEFTVRCDCGRIFSSSRGSQYQRCFSCCYTGDNDE